MTADFTCSNRFNLKSFYFLADLLKRKGSGSDADASLLLNPLKSIRYQNCYFGIQAFHTPLQSSR